MQLINYLHQGKLKDNMIECSPQQLIAGSLHNCYTLYEPKRHIELIKSAPKDKFHFASPRKNQKTSLKKPTSLKQLIRKPEIFTQRPYVAQGLQPKQVYFEAPTPKFYIRQKEVEIKNNMVFQTTSRQQIVRITYMNQNHVRPDNIYTTKKQNQYADIVKEKVQSSQFSRAQTLHSFRSLQSSNEKQKQFQSTQINQSRKVQSVKAKQLQNLIHADKNSIVIKPSSKPSLKSMRPKDVQSFCDENIDEDQISQVIQSYYPNKYQIEKQNI